MHTESFELSRTVSLTPLEAFHAFADSKALAKLLGQGASSKPDGTVHAPQGFVFGRALDVEPGKRLVRSYRATTFADGTEDARAELRFEPVGRGATLVSVHQTGLPQGQADACIALWLERCLDPLAQPKPRR